MSSLWKKIPFQRGIRVKKWSQVASIVCETDANKHQKLPATSFVTIRTFPKCVLLLNEAIWAITKTRGQKLYTREYNFCSSIGCQSVFGLAVYKLSLSLYHQYYIAAAPSETKLTRKRKKTHQIFNALSSKSFPLTKFWRPKKKKKVGLLSSFMCGFLIIYSLLFPDDDKSVFLIPD